MLCNFTVNEITSVFFFVLESYRRNISSYYFYSLNNVDVMRITTCKLFETVDKYKKWLRFTVFVVLPPHWHRRRL